MSKSSKGKQRKRSGTSFPHLSRAPIIEAVIEVKGPIGIEWNEQAALSHLQELRADYPVRQSLQGLQGHLELTRGSEPKMETKDLGPRGVRFQSSDGFNVAMFTADLFSFSRLTTYQSWADLVSEALKLWKLYKNFVQQNHVDRLGVRFINRIPLPGERVKIESYFNKFPAAVPGHDPDRLTFLHQDLISMPRGGLKANIIKTVQPGSATDPRVALILDIDVFDETRFTAEEEVLKVRLDQIHYWKNWIFFNTVTKDLVAKLK